MFASIVGILSAVAVLIQRIPTPAQSMRSKAISFIADALKRQAARLQK